MFFKPYSTQHYPNFRVINPNISYIRFLNASPNTQPVDIYINNKLIGTNLQFKDFTNYMPIIPGVHNIKFFALGTKKPIINKNLIIPDSRIFTIPLIDSLDNINIEIVEDPKQKLTPGKTNLRFINLSPNTPEVNLYIKNVGKVFENVGFTDITNYIELSPKSYEFDVRLDSNDKSIVKHPDANFTANRFYSIYLVGVLDGKPPIQVLIPLDGNSYL